MKKKLCAVVIPVYKDHLEKYEELSFRQCLKVLSDYPIILVTYRQLDVSVYDSISSEYEKQIEKVFFPESCF